MSINSIYLRQIPKAVGPIRMLVTRQWLSLCLRSVPEMSPVIGCMPATVGIKPPVFTPISDLIG